jgi:hypothetical protein
MKRPVQILLCLVPSFAAGWWLMESFGTATPVAAAAPVSAASRPTDEAMAPLRAAKDRWTAIHAAIQLARSIPPRERQEWLEGVRFRHADPLVVEMFKTELEELLFQEDPYALVAAQIASGKQSAGAHLTRLAKLDPAKLIAFGQAAADPVHGRRMIFAGMTELVTSDPATVLKLALEFPPPVDGNELPKDMVRLLAKAGGNDAEKLLDLSDARGDRWRSMLRAAAAQATVTKNFAQGLQWIAAQPDAGVLFKSLFSVGGISMEEMKTNARKIAENLGALPPEFVATVRRAAFANSWPLSYDISGAEDIWLAADLKRLGFPAKEQSRIRLDAMRSLVWQDAATVAKYLADPAFLAAEDRKALLLDLQVRQLQGMRPMAPEILAALGEADRKLLAEAEAKFRSNQQQAPKGPLSVPEQIVASMTEKGSEALHLQVVNWGPEQMDEALAYIRGAKPEILKEMVKRIQRTGAPPLPLAAELYRLALVNNMATPKVREELIETSIHWGSRQPAKAAAWVETLPAGPERLCSIQNVAAQWSAGDPSGAAAWIATLKDSAESEAAKEAVKIYNEKTKHAQRGEYGE